MIPTPLFRKMRSKVTFWQMGHLWQNCRIEPNISPLFDKWLYLPIFTYGANAPFA